MNLLLNLDLTNPEQIKVTIQFLTFDKRIIEFKKELELLEKFKDKITINKIRIETKIEIILNLSNLYSDLILILKELLKYELGLINKILNNNISDDNLLIIEQLIRDYNINYDDQINLIMFENIKQLIDSLRHKRFNFDRFNYIINKIMPDITNSDLDIKVRSFFIKIFKMLNKLLERYDKTLIPITITFNYFINKFIYSFLESIFSNKIEDVIRSNNKIILCIKKILNNNFKVDQIFDEMNIDINHTDSFLFVDYENITDYNDRNNFTYPNITDKPNIRYNHPLYFLINFALNKGINKIFIVFKSYNFIKSLKKDYIDIINGKLIDINTDKKIIIHIKQEIIDYLKKIDIYCISIDNYLLNMDIQMSDNILHSFSGYDDALLMILLSDIYSKIKENLKIPSNIHLMTKDNKMFDDFVENKRYLLPFNINLFKFKSDQLYKIYTNMIITLNNYKLSFSKDEFIRDIARGFNNNKGYEEQVKINYFKPSMKGRPQNWIGKNQIDLNINKPQLEDEIPFYNKYKKYKNKYLELKSKL